MNVITISQVDKYIAIFKLCVGIFDYLKHQDRPWFPVWGQTRFYVLRQHKIKSDSH